MTPEDVSRGFHLLPRQSSTLAPQVDAVFLGLVVISTLVLVVVTLLLLRFAIHYRHSNPRANREDRIKTRVEYMFEFSWTLVPALIFIGFFAWSAWLYVRMYDIPPGGLQIQAVGKQWMWKFQHPGGQWEINELHVPAGEKVVVTLASQDVIHSFFVPDFRVKRDAVPGMFNQVWFEATEPGVHQLFCAEYCGSSHSKMRGRVVVLSREDYAAWLQRQQTEASLAAQGGELFRDYGCSGCHTRNSPVHAPDLAGLYGRPVQLSDGSSVIADEAYIRDSILLPQKQVVIGFEPIMPSFAGQIEEEDILKIIEFIKSLQPGEVIME